MMQVGISCHTILVSDQTNINDLPPEMLYEIFSNLDNVDLSTCRKVNRIWYHICDHLLKVSVMNDITFGKKEWDKHIGVVEEPPPLPKNLHEIVEQVCRGIDEKKKIKETLMLQLIPKTVNGKPYCLDLLLEDLFPVSIYCILYDHILRKKFGINKIKKSYWVLFSKSVLNKSRSKGAIKQMKLVEEINGCRLPKMIEAATCILLHHVKTGEEIYEQERTLCMETLICDIRQVVRHTYAKNGHHFSSNIHLQHYNGKILEENNFGAAVLRKL